MSSLPTVLIFTYPEYGQANVNLAASYELVLSGVSVHIASFASLRNRVTRFREFVARHAARSDSKLTGSITFHECKGFTPYGEAIGKHGITAADAPHPPGVSGALGCYPLLDVYFFPWGREEYLLAIEGCKKVIANVKPDIVVTDTLFYPAQDACSLVGQKFMMMSPNSIKDIAMSAQPNMAPLWKYPAISSGFPFPLKWWQLPLNIYLNIRLIMYLTTLKQVKEIEDLRKSLGLRSIFALPYPGVKYVTPALAETDFSLVIPEEIDLCGPIVMPFDSLEEIDPALVKWLDNGPTVMINLGSHILADANIAREMADAIRILLDSRDRKRLGNIQVLWKVKANGEIQAVIEEIIGKEMEEGSVKVVAWLEAEPVAVLQHPNLVCTVHHGGANSFYEGILSGLPHVVLPVWFDTYDYAARVEYLGIGIYASKTSAPNVRAMELGPALVRITGDNDEAIKFRAKARRLKEICRAKGNGRELAAAAILKEASSVLSTK